MTDQPGTVQLTLPRPTAARLLALLGQYASALTDSPPGWMDDDEIAARGDDADEVRALLALLSPQTTAAPATAPGPTAVSADDVRALAQGLLDIAEIAMPDTYFATDSRCQLARTVLAATDEG